MGHWEQIAAERLRAQQNPPPRRRRVLNKIGFGLFVAAGTALVLLQAYVLLAPLAAALFRYLLR